VQKGKAGVMTSLKFAFFWVAIYLAIIYVLGVVDYLGNSIIDFASYFYILVIVAIPTTLFIPSIAKASKYVPLGIWAGIYIVILQSLNRTTSTTPGELSVIILEFIFLEIGVWLAHVLSIHISHAESVMDALAFTAFPSQSSEIDSESKRIKLEILRSRRYQRPLGLVVIDSKLNQELLTKELFKNIQNDLLFRFTAARVGQIIDYRVRQTDIVMRDHGGRYVVLCPETDLDSATILAIRIAKDVKIRTDLEVRWGVSAFPEEALTFDDLLEKARLRSAEAKETTNEQPFILTE